MTKRNRFVQTDGTRNGGSPRTKELCERVKCYCFRMKKKCSTVQNYSNDLKVTSLLD